MGIYGIYTHYVWKPRRPLSRTRNLQRTISAICGALILQRMRSIDNLRILSSRHSSTVVQHCHSIITQLSSYRVHEEHIRIPQIAEIVFRNLRRTISTICGGLFPQIAETQQSQSRGQAPGVSLCGVH